MVIQFTTQTGTIFVNPDYIVAVREDKHFGRPGVGEKNMYSDTLIQTTKGDFNVQETPEAVAAAVNAVQTGPKQFV